MIRKDQVDLAALDAQLYALMTPQQRAHEERLSSLLALSPTRTVIATHGDRRGRFVAVEHFNVGPGWMMRRHGEGSIVSSFQLTDLQADRPGGDE